MQYRKSDDTITITVTELAAHARTTVHPSVVSEKYGFVPVQDMPTDNPDYRVELDPATEGIRIHHQLATDRLTENHTAGAEVELAWRFEVDGMWVELHGCGDSITFDGEIHTVEEYKTVSSLRRDLTPLTYPAHFAQAICYATMVCLTCSVDKAAVQLTYIRRADGMRTSFRTVLPYSELEKMTIGLLYRAAPFFRIAKERATLRPAELQNLPFPYPAIRPGQKDFIHEAFRTIRTGGHLFVSAPCGIGKTISSLYPSLRAVGMGKADRIFYCTAKTITGKAALAAAARLAKHAPHMRAILLLAKEQMCNTDVLDGERDLAIKCSICPDMHATGWEHTYRSYAQRQEEAVLELLQNHTIYTPEMLEECADRHEVCPHELALDVSEYCDLIVCDYNYVFDDSIRLRRYFKDVKRQEKYIFLVDEAHNLPDRARAMYSAALSLNDIHRLRDIKEKLFGADDAFEDSLCQVEKCFTAIGRLCDREAALITENGREYREGYYKSRELPGELEKRLGNLLGILRRYIRDKHEFAGELMVSKQTLQAFAGVLPYMDEHFCFFAHGKQSADEGEGMETSFTIQVLCLDPGGILSSMLSAAHASVFFSATLAPAEYYQNVTGSPDSVYLDLPSPYEKDNLCLVAYDGISTRYSDRRGTAEETAKIIARTVETMAGNYIVYFPSYKYMRAVYSIFRTMLPEVKTVLQKNGMSFQDRETFLSFFEKEQYPTLVGFCVLGGMFSEGIDLIGNSLIGVIVVGTGLPGLSAELNLTAEYYQNISENGREFAYVYPGMNKVLQAAGRVIRSESDRGVVLLIDDRYNEPGMKRLFPAHWQHIRYTADPDSLKRILQGFWHI